MRTFGMGGQHAGQPLLNAGEPPEQARAALLMVHGRGASAQDILSYAAELMTPGVAYLAPQAAGNSWYPNSFLAPTASNKPWLSSALATLDSVIDDIMAAAVPLARIMLLGF